MSQVDVRTSKEVAEMRQDANEMLFTSEEVAKIATPEQEATAVEFLSQAKRKFKVYDEKRKAWVKPLKGVIDDINDTFNAILDPLEQVERIVKKGMVDYRSREDFKKKEQERIQKEAQARMAARDIKYDGLNKDNMKALQEANNELQEANSEAPRVVGTESGSASFRKDWKFEVVDRTQLPKEIIFELIQLAFEKGLADQVIRRQIKEGRRTISGVKMWEESTPIIRA